MLCNKLDFNPGMVGLPKTAISEQALQASAGSLCNSKQRYNQRRPGKEKKKQKNNLKIKDSTLIDDTESVILRRTTVLPPSTSQRELSSDSPCLVWRQRQGPTCQRRRTAESDMRPRSLLIAPELPEVLSVCGAPFFWGEPCRICFGASLRVRT